MSLTIPHFSSICLLLCLSASWTLLLSDSPRPGRIWSVGGQDNGCGQFSLTTDGEQLMLMCQGRLGTERENRMLLKLGYFEQGLATLTLKKCFSKFSRPGMVISWSTCFRCRVQIPTSRLLHCIYPS